MGPGGQGAKVQSLLTAQELERQGIPPPTANLPGGYEYWWAPSLIKRPWNKRIDMGEDTREDFQYIHASAYVQAHTHKCMHTIYAYPWKEGEKLYSHLSQYRKMCLTNYADIIPSIQCRISMEKVM